MKYIPSWIHTPLPIIPKIENLQDWISRIESTQSIRNGLETRINFAHKTVQKTEFSILYLHGFGSSVNETSPLTSIIAKTIKANVIYQRLDKHGISLAPLAYLTAESWYYNALQGLSIANKLGENVIVLSCSTGGTLSLLLSARHTSAQEISHQVLLSPNCGPRPGFTLKLFLHPPLVPILEAVSGLTPTKDGSNKSKHITFTSISALQSQNCSLRVPVKTLTTMMQLVQLIWTIKKTQPHWYKIPTSIIACPNDRKVLFQKTKTFFKKYNPPCTLELFTDTTSQDSHVLAGDIYSAHTTQTIAEIILSLLSPTLDLTKTNNNDKINQEIKT